MGREYTSKKIAQEPDAYSNLVYPVDIIGGGFVKDSVGGVDPYVGVRNNSGKDIKYITMEMTPFNRVNDPVTCTIRGYSTTTCTATGPFEPDVGIGQGMYSITSGALWGLGSKKIGKQFHCNNCGADF